MTDQAVLMRLIPVLPAASASDADPLPRAMLAQESAGAPSFGTLTLCAETLCVSTASTGDGERRRQESSSSFAVCQPLSTADLVQAEDLR